MALPLTAWILASAVWSSAYASCNQKLAAQPNEVVYITSPGYPGNFTQYVDCYYELYSTSDHPGLLVYVDVVDVTLNCADDTTHLHVYDGFSRNPRFLGRICEGGQRTFQSPKQTLYITFRSRAHHAGRSRGFRLRVRTVPKYCHCFTQETAVVEATPSPALLSSPYYPYGTEPNVNCRWLLKAPAGKRVNVTLLHTDMKGSEDCHHFGLYLYDGKTSYDDKLLASVCHNSAQSLQSSGPYLLVIFKSGPLVYRSGGGVKLQYTAIPADGSSDRQTISHTLFYIITALLILLIFVIIFIAIIKLFLLPKRRKEAERRRRAARARLTRVNRHAGSSGQSDPASHSESAVQHASCSPQASSVSGTSQLSGMSLARLLSLYGLKKCRQEHRCSGASRADHDGPPECVYPPPPHRAGVVCRVPDFLLGVLPGDLPPSYEEATGQGVTGREVRGEQAEGQSGSRQSAEGHSGSRQSVEGHSGSRQSAEGHSGSRQSAEGHSGSRQSAEGHSGSRQSAEGHSGSRQSVEGHSGSRQSAEGHSGSRQSAEGHSGSRQSAEGHSGSRQSAEGHSGWRQSAEGQGARPRRHEHVRQAAAEEARIARPSEEPAPDPDSPAEALAAEQAVVAEVTTPAVPQHSAPQPSEQLCQSAAADATQTTACCPQIRDIPQTQASRCSSQELETDPSHPADVCDHSTTTTTNTTNNTTNSPEPPSRALRRKARTGARVAEATTDADEELSVHSSTSSQSQPVSEDFGPTRPELAYTFSKHGQENACASQGLDSLGSV